VPVLMPVYAVGELALLLINVFLVAIVVQVVVSWQNRDHNAVNSCCTVSPVRC
jgi:hypothetical protein